MKNLLSFFYLLCICACSQKIYNTQTKNNAATEEGTIRVYSSGKGKSLPGAYNNAVENAFSALLFKGIPESVQTTPMIPNESEAKEKYSEVLSCFSSEACYKQFITSASQVGQKERIRGDKLFNYQVNADVVINIRSLRSYLEQKNVIRKFGF